MRKILILGGTRSGKSQFALKVGEGILNREEKGLFLATAVPFDDEMKRRIERHRISRKETWVTVEEPINIVDVIERSVDYNVILIDCLTLWLSNVYLNMCDRLSDFMLRLCEVVEKSRKNIILVSNEVGLGIVPDNRMAREFRDLAGELNQRVANVSSEVYFTIAGIPSRIK